jgi:hypothetical protein
MHSTVLAHEAGINMACPEHETKKFCRIIAINPAKKSSAQSSSVAGFVDRFLDVVVVID